MTRRVYDRRLLQLFAHALQRLQGYMPDNHVSVTLKPIVENILSDGRRRLEVAVEASGDERREASQARDTLARVEADAGALFGRVYHALVADHHTRAAHGDTANTSHTVALDRFVEGYTPAIFEGTSIANRVDVMGEAARLAGHFLHANWPGLASEVASMHTQLSAAVAAYQAETGEADAALLARDAAFEAARIDYLAARDLLAGALRLDNKSELLGKWIPPVSDIRGKPGAPPTPADSDAVTDSPIDAEYPVSDAF